MASIAASDAASVIDYTDVEDGPLKYPLSPAEITALANRVQTLVSGVSDVLSLLQDREADEEVFVMQAGAARDALDNLLFELRKRSRKPASETASGAASTTA